MRRTLQTSLLALFGALLLTGLGCSHRAVAGRVAPPFTIKLSNGQQVSLATYRGRVLVLNFWASWCPPCVQETPALNAMSQDFPQNKVAVLGISIDADPVAYQTFLAKYDIHYATGRDPSEDIMHRYGTVQIPETYIIGPNGRVDRKLVSVANFTSPTMIAYLQNLAAGDKS